MKRNILAAAPYTDMAEIAWLNECYSKTYAELADPGPARFKRLDLMLGKCLASVIHNSGETLSEDVFLADRDANEAGRVVGGRQMVWMILDFFKTHRSMAIQYSYEDLKSVPWLGDSRIKEFYDHYRLVKSAVLELLPLEDAQIQMFYDKIKTSKVLQIDLREFDRYEEGDPRRTLRFLEQSVERVISRRNLEEARRRQEQRLTLGVGADTGLRNTTPAGPAAAAGAGRGKGGRTGAGKGGRSGRGGLKGRPNRKGGKGKGGPKGGAGKGKGNHAWTVDAPCYHMYFSTTGCTWGDRCRFRHDLSQAQANSRQGSNASTPTGTPRGRNRSQSPSGKGGKGGKQGGKKGKQGGKTGKTGKGKNNANAAAAGQEDRPTKGKGKALAAAQAEVAELRSNLGRAQQWWCSAYLRGDCRNEDGNCPNGAHLTQEQLTPIREAITRQRAAAKAKAAARTPSPQAKATAKAGSGKGKSGQP